MTHYTYQGKTYALPDGLSNEEALSKIKASLNGNAEKVASGELPALRPAEPESNMLDQTPTGNPFIDAATAGIGVPSAMTGEDAAKNLAVGLGILGAGGAVAAAPAVLASPIGRGLATTAAVKGVEKVTGFNVPAWLEAFIDVASGASAVKGGKPLAQALYSLLIKGEAGAAKAATKQAVKEAPSLILDQFGNPTR